MKFVKFSTLLIMALFIVVPSVRAMDIPQLAPNAIIPKTVDEQLFDAAKVGDCALVASLINNGANVNFQGIQKWTPLHCAARDGHLTVAQLLLDRGAYVNAPTETGAIPLHMAAGFGFISIARLLLDRGSHVHALATNGNAKGTPLFAAVHHFHVSIVVLLLDKGAHIDVPGCINPLTYAASRNNALVVEILLSYGAQIPHAVATNAVVIQAQDNRLKLSQAKDFKTVAKLLSQGAFAYPMVKAFVVDPKRQELFAAIERDDVQAVARLLKEGFTLNTCDKEGNTVLHKAIKDKRTKVFDLLLSLGVHVYLGRLNAQGDTPAMLLADGWHNAIETLIKCGYNDQAQAVSGKRKQAGQ